VANERLNLASKTRSRKHGRNPGHRRSGSAESVSAIGPLSKFLEGMDDVGDSRLAAVAAEEVARGGFDPAKLRHELVQKLKHVKFPSPEERAIDRPTFYEYLQNRHCIQRVLERSTLREIWYCSLIPRILDRDRKLERENLSLIGYPVRFHRRLYLEAEENGHEIENLIERFGATAWMKKYRHHFKLQFRDNVTLFLLSDRYTGNRRELVGSHRKAQLIVKVTVYWTLWARLHGPHKIPNRFLRQLSLLINAPLSVTELNANEAEALRDAIENHEQEWRKLLKISQNE